MRGSIVVKETKTFLVSAPPAGRVLHLAAMLNQVDLLDKMIAARAIVLGSPNYYYDVSGLMKNMIDRSISSSYLGIGEYTGMAWHGWRPFFDKVGGVIICQAAFGAEKAIETFKCFGEYSGLNLMGEVIASVGNQTVTDFPEYLEETRQLGFNLKEA